MRTLKKTLCMVLVLAMMVGLCAISASAATIADYKDKDKITHPEAVATLTAIGVLQGDDQGNFRATDSLNRAESTAFYTRLCAATGAGTSTFTDMAGFDWAQPYVAYCEANKIVSGFGDGTFHPSDAVITVQWAKMGLVAIGYDPVIEGLVGPQWEINTIKLCNTLNLCRGFDPDWEAPISRDDSAQFAYNVLQATMVEYKGGMNVNVQTGDGTTVQVTEDSDWYYVANNSYDYKNRSTSTTGGSTMQFCENYFPRLKMATNQPDKTFGFRENVWFMGDSRVDHNLTKEKKIVSELASTIMATYDTGMATVTGKTLYNDGKANEKTNLTVIVNGAYYTGPDIYMDRLGAAPVLGSFKGSTAYLIDTSSENTNGYGIADTLIIKQPLLATVTKVNAATASKDRYVNLKVYATPTGTTFDYTTDDFAKGDYLLVYPSNTAFDTTTEIYEAKVAETVKGTLTKVAVAPTVADPSVKVASALTVEGVVYSVGSNANLGPKGQAVACEAAAYQPLGGGLTAYISNGFVMGLIADAVAYGDYVFVIDTDWNGSTISSVTWTVGSVDQAGTAVELKSATDPGSPMWATKTEGAGGLYTFTEAMGGTAGTTPLTHYVTMDGLSSSKAALGTDLDGNTIVADNNTVFVLRTVNPTTHAVSYKSYKGLANVPNYYGAADAAAAGKTALNANAYALVPAYPNAHAAAVYIDVLDGDTKNTATNAIYLINGTSNGPERVGNKDYGTYTAIIDGELKTILGTQPSFSLYGLVIPTFQGEYLAGTEAYNGTAYTTDIVYEIAVDTNVITVNGAPYVLNANATAYVYTALNFAKPLESGTPGEYVAGLKTGKITLVEGKDGTISTIYVIK